MAVTVSLAMTQLPADWMRFCTALARLWMNGVDDANACEALAIIGLEVEVNVAMAEASSDVVEASSEVVDARSEIRESIDVICVLMTAICEP